ncbi:asparagine synthase, partial [Xanthomonas sp. Kuri4-1]
AGHRRPVDQAAWAQAASAPALVQHLLEACWGEYLLLVPGREAGAVTVMRDPSGGVGCVYALREGFLTSDITLATRAGLYARQVDWEFIQGTLRYPHHKAGRTGLAGLRELLPGCRLDLDRAGAHVEPVWSPWAFVAPACRHRDRATAQAEVRHAVASSVRQWADTDAAVLLELSGGLDSSVVAACLAGTPARVACCNLVTPVPGADERSYARRMAEALQVELQVRTLGFEQTPVDCPPPAHAVMPGTGFLQHASNALKEAIGRQLGIDRFFSGGGGDTVFGYTRSAAPAADAFRECGAGAGLAAVRDLAELHQCT